MTLLCYIGFTGQWLKQHCVPVSLSRTRDDD